jgi:hypothetical protein
MVPVLAQPITEMSTRNIPGENVAALTFQPYGTSRLVTGIALPFF